eukprot:Polyplicarium_translucidae@DN296_c0_g1_i2.p1
MMWRLLRFLDELLTTIDVDLLTSQTVQAVKKANAERGGPDWIEQLGPADQALELGPGLAQSSVSRRVFISSFRVGRLALILNLRSGSPDAAGGPGALRPSVEQRERASPASVMLFLLGGTPEASRILAAAMAKDQEGTALRQQLEQSSVEDEAPQTEFIRAILSALSLRASISDAQLLLSAREYKDICATARRLTQELLYSYFGQGIRQIHKVLGAVDLLGNPAKIFKHVKSGAVNASQDFRRGLRSGRLKVCWVLAARAGWQLTKGGLSGALDFATRCMGSYCSLLDAAASNTDQMSYQLRMANRGLRDQPSTALEGIWFGCSSCSRSLALSAINIFYKPFQSIRLSLRGVDKLRRTHADVCVASCRGLGRGVAGSARSVLGVPASFLLFGQLWSSGMLNQISAVHMSARPHLEGQIEVALFEVAHYCS